MGQENSQAGPQLSKEPTQGYALVEKTENSITFVATSNKKALDAVKVENKQFEQFGIQSSWKNSQENLFEPKRNWGLVGMILDAYNKHHDLILRPEDFWQAILTQFSFYVNANAEQLRDRIVDFEGEKELTVHMGDHTIYTVDHALFANRMVHEQVVKNIKDPSMVEWLQPNFSTTTETDKTVACISIMASLQKYFNFGMMLGCGLPKVTLLGTEEDWVKLRGKIDKLKDFEIGQQMEKWHSLLAKILDKLVESAQGKDCLYFWDRVISQWAAGSGGATHITGWASVFCAFDSKGQWIAEDSRSFEYPSVDMDSIAKGVCVVPIKVNDNGQILKTKMCAGHFAFKVQRDQTAICPSIDWSVELEDDYNKRTGDDKIQDY